MSATTPSTPQRKRGTWMRIAVLVVAAPVLYFVSFGPVCLAAAWIDSWGLMPNWLEGLVELFYWPLELAVTEWPKFRALMNWYARLLMPLRP